MEGNICTNSFDPAPPTPTSLLSLHPNGLSCQINPALVSLTCDFMKGEVERKRKNSKKIILKNPPISK